MIDENKNLAIREEKSTARPLVSVCISVYNGEAHLRKCLDSVISQDIDCMEIVLVNDGSTDSTSEIMYEYRDRFPGIRIIEQENRGLTELCGQVIGPFTIRQLLYLFTGYADPDCCP